MGANVDMIGFLHHGVAPYPVLTEQYGFPLFYYQNGRKAGIYKRYSVPDGSGMLSGSGNSDINYYYWGEW